MGRRPGRASAAPCRCLVRPAPPTPGIGNCSTGCAQRRRTGCFHRASPQVTEHIRYPLAPLLDQSASRRSGTRSSTPWQIGTANVCEDAPVLGAPPAGRQRTRRPGSRRPQSRRPSRQKPRHSGASPDKQSVRRQRAPKPRRSGPRRGGSRRSARRQVALVADQGPGASKIDQDPGPGVEPGGDLGDQPGSRIDEDDDQHHVQQALAPVEAPILVEPGEEGRGHSVPGGDIAHSASCMPTHKIRNSRAPSRPCSSSSATRASRRTIDGVGSQSAPARRAWS